jgi:hypothetical protein
MVADSAISYPKTKALGAHHTDWLKLLPVPRISGGVSYWGTIGAISGRTPFDKWLQAVIDRGAYTDLRTFADCLASALNTACNNKPLPNDAPVGVHVAGHHPWPDGQTRPTFYHVHNGHAALEVKQTLDKRFNPPKVLETTGKWVGEARKLFAKHLDFPFAQFNRDQNLRELARGYTTRNGDYLPYVIIDQGLEAVRTTLNTIPGISLPSEPNKLGSRIGYLCLVMRTVIDIYNCSTLEKYIGGEVTALGIRPDGRYEATPSRKSKFTAVRTSTLRKLP